MTRNLINPARVDFVTLRLFCAVVDSGSITKGAAQCHLALSAASRRLRDFETAAGTPLLERSAQGVTLTPAGHVAAQHAVRLFQGFELFSGELADFSQGYRGHVRLWANMASLVEFLPAALSDFMAQQPGIRVDIEEQMSADTARALRDGLADIGVFADGVPADGLTLVPFRHDTLVLLCPRSHPLAKARKLAFAECLAHEFVGLNRGSALLKLTSHAASEAGQPMRMRVQVRSFDAMCQMIAAGLGVGVLPLAACEKWLGPRGLQAVRLSDAWAHRPLVLGYHRQRPLSAAARLLVEHLMDPGATLQD
jgi:DNA-binding transcriptional LysR family regulator